MRNVKVEGIILKRRNYNEADRMLTVFTKDGYKISVKAAGVRRISSRRASHIELLNFATLNLYQTPQIAVLTEAQMIESFNEIKHNLDKVGLAYHMCELIDGLCPENEENRAVFELFKDTLHRLAAASSSPHRADRVISASAATPENDSIEDYALPAEEAFLAALSQGRSSYNYRYGRSDDPLLITHEFEVELLTLLGFWNRAPKDSITLDTQDFIENILERKLKSRKIFDKLQ